MPVFGSYAKLYNMLYSDKDYPAEADFVHGILQKTAPGTKKILDLGCGAGKHDILLAHMGYRLKGIDLSAEMLSLARASSAASASRVPVDFCRGDIRTIRLDEQFDAVTSLFHVMSYQTTNNDLRASFNTAYRHLKPGGIFLFDFWYGPAVLTQRPEKREKHVRDKAITIVRNAEPDMHPNSNTVDVRYVITTRDTTANSTETIRETHRMRYWFLPEIEFFLEQEGFALLETAEWMTGAEPGLGTWSVYCVCRT